MQVIIRHRDGREYEIDSAAFRRGKHAINSKGERVTYEEAGFKIVSLADGRPYVPPAPRDNPA
jgi:hypothetical protein